MATLPDPDLAPQQAPPIVILPPVGQTGGLSAHQELRPIGEETIQIAPHPTTNRYPWAPVENPTVPVYQTVTVLDPAAPAAVLAPPVVPVRQPAQVSPEAVPSPPEPTVLPVEQPASEPMPPIEPPPPPVILPRPEPPAALVTPPALAPLPLPPPAIQPIMQPPLQPAEMIIQHTPPPAPTIVTAPMQSVPDRAQPAVPAFVRHIYSDYTREVWRVFGPNRVVQYLLYGCLLLVVGGGIVLWLLSGASTDITSLPLIRDVLNSQ